MSTKTDESSSKPEENKAPPRKYTQEELEEHQRKLMKKMRFMRISC